MKKNWLMGLKPILFMFSVFLFLFTSCNQEPKKKGREDDKKGKIIISSVSFEGLSCKEDGTLGVDVAEGDLLINFTGSYEDLSVKVNNNPVAKEGTSYKAHLTGITEAGLPIKIEANAKNKDKKEFNFTIKKIAKGEIAISSVSFEGLPCEEGGTLGVDVAEGDLLINFTGSYEDLSVKVNNNPVAKEGTSYKAHLTGIIEAGLPIKIEANAKNKDKKEFNFTIKKIAKGEIVISSVSFEGLPCEEGGTLGVDVAEGDLLINFTGSYENLSVKVNNNPVAKEGTSYKTHLTGITEAGLPIKIEANAKNKDKKEFNFTIKQKELPNIDELIFKGKDINEDSSNPYGKDEKKYYATKAPFLTDIKSDGSTKVGDSKDIKIRITIKYPASQAKVKLQVKNATTDVSADESNGIYGRVESDIDLQKGDNNIIITYKEENKKDLVYKVIVGYVERDYEPISKVEIHGIVYGTKEAFERLESGGDKISVAGLDSIDVKCDMPELWYNDTNEYSITIDGVKYGKDAFQKTAWFPNPTWSIKKSVNVDKTATKTLKIIFENVARNYKKEYKVDIVYYDVYEIESLLFIDGKTTKKIAGKVTNSFKFDNDKGYYNAKTNFLALDRVDKATFLLKAKKDDVMPKYALSTTKKEPKDITSYTPFQKKNFKYKDGTQELEVETYVAENLNIEYGKQYLYLLLEKGEVKTYYITEVERVKIKDDNAKGEQELIYKDSAGKVLPKSHPLSMKGLIRVLPESPRAKVSLLTPEVKEFTKNPSDDWWEVEIDLTKNKTRFSYKIVAENNTTEKIYNDSYYQTFTKDAIIKEVKFAYKVNEYEHKREKVEELEPKFYLSFKKDRVIEKKLYLFIKSYKGVDIETVTDITQIEKKDGDSSTNYVFELDIKDILDTPLNKKDYVLPCKLDSKDAGMLGLCVYPKDEIIDAISVRGNLCVLIPEGSNNHWICKANMNISAYKRIVIDLYLLAGETADNTNRKIELFKGAEKLDVEIDKSGKDFLTFIHKNFSIQDKETITLTLKYFADKTSNDPTKTYTIEVTDL